MDDIQSWWEVPSIAHFCSLFRVAFNLLDFDIEELEEALLTDGTELNGNSLIQDLIVRLLSGCLGHNGISTFNYQMFLRRLFRAKCKEQGRDNPFNTDVDFQSLPLRTKVEILHALCDFRLDADDVIDVLKNLDSDSLRVHPLGHDESKSAYWYFYGTRLYKEEYPRKRKKKKDHDRPKKKRKDGNSSSSEDEYERRPTGMWKVMCYTEQDWRELTRSMARSSCREERALYTVLSEDFLPEIPRLFEEKERLQRKRAAEQAPRRTSRRLARQEENRPKDERYSERERVNREKMEQRERQARQMMKGSVSDSEGGSSNSEGGLVPAFAGRQTNNSLSSATGDIYIQASQSHKFSSSQHPYLRRTREDLMTGMYKVLDTVKDHEDAWPFRDPVNENYAPRYYSVIAKPMDLQTMEDKLDNGEYGSLQQFKADFQLIVDNCRQYNGSGNDYTDMVKRLQECFESSIKLFLESDGVSDDDRSPLHHQLQDLTTDSSLSPLNRPLSRSSSQDSSIDSSRFIKRDVKEESFLNRDNKVDKNRLRRKQKHRKKNAKVSSNAESDDSSDSDPFLEKRRSNHHLRDVSSDMKTSSSRDSSKDRSKERSRKRVRVKRKGVPQKDRAREKLSTDDTTTDTEMKEKTVGSSRDTSKERSRVRVNYRETSEESESLFSDTSDDSRFESKLKAKTSPKKPVKKAGVIKNVEAIEALEIATEQTLRDINRWLDDTPRFSDFSSCSNSPLHMPPYMEDMAAIEGEYRRRLMMDRPMRPRDRFSNELHRRRMFKEQMGLKRRREIQRTIDRLQPGKGKGNLLSKDNQQNHVDGSGAESKSQTNVNDENTPKISLGKVLPSDIISFGISESASKKNSEDDCTEDKVITEDVKEEKDEKPKDEEELKEKEATATESVCKPVESTETKPKEKPTPNLSAWFKAFGAPKTQPQVKKKVEQEENKKDDDDEDRRINAIGIQSPARRQRKTSTGSSVSERSSFSIEPVDGNSPRRSLDEPYVSPQQEMKTYPSPINGTIKVGFYQDTCFPRGTSEKSSSPRDPTGCSPRDLPSISPRNPAFSPHDYPNASPRTPYGSPRHHPISPVHHPMSPVHHPMSPVHHPMSPVHHPMSPVHHPMSPIHHPMSPIHHPMSPVHHPMSPVHHPEYIGSPRRELPDRDYPRSPIHDYPRSPHPHDYPDTSPRSCSSPKEPAPLSPYASPHPSHAAPIYSHYPSHLAAYYESNKSLELRNNEKAPKSIYPVKKRGYNEVGNSTCKPSEPPIFKSGGSFTPTREAMEQERTFTPTPGRMPGPAQNLRVQSPMPIPISHPLHYDPYADERRISSPFYSGDAIYKNQPSSPRPIYPQPSAVLPANYRRETREDRQDRDIPHPSTPVYPPSRPSTPSYPQSPHSEPPKTPLIAFSSRPSTPAHNTSPSSTPINYSNANPESSNKDRSPSPNIINRPEENLDHSASQNYKKSCDLSSRKTNSPSTPISFAGNRYNDVLPQKVSSTYSRAMPDIPHGLNYSSQDLSKLSVPLSYSNQSELLSGKMNYNHPMADLMQSSARYNYPMPELIQGKPTVYNHPMQDFMQGKAAAAYSNMNLSSFSNRPISEIMQSKVNDIQAREMAYSQRSIPTSKSESTSAKPGKKSRKKKSEVPASGFQQYVAPSSEPISLKSSSSVVPGSAFNFGAPLKESYGQYLDEIRSSYFVPHPEGSSGKGAAPPYFLGHTSSRAQTAYHPFMNAQYQQYLQRHPEELLRPMVLHHLPHAAGYPHAYLGMHDAINRPSWL